MILATLTVLFYRFPSTFYGFFYIPIYLFILFFAILPLFYCYKGYTSELIIDLSGVAVQHSLKNVKLKWDEITRIEYSFSRLTKRKKIILHCEQEQKIYITHHWNNYLEAIRIVVSECLKLNPNVLLDNELRIHLEEILKETK